ncbi:hypothetical protein SAMN04244553_0163 [Nocardia amikacinitolerans]|uniref:HEAT repeat-containing protein n=2 Tax=Nocardia amikacinitolerans TaxID=756689 RepID=A0A285M1S3_9NOCA|nr:HEAT repeat domain-containing protein [Nocardia amikacinitolerans]MCP2299381.1 HEAT repeat-containing protein [Nocardia amikacinitolerans]SNY89846.1 hypothetical protein SAMN04244553_0163 [Nocardia amikacinitolerans]
MATDTEPDDHPADPVQVARDLATLSTRVGDLARAIAAALARVEQMASTLPGDAVQLREWCREMDRQLDGLYRYRKQLMARSMHVLAEKQAADAPAVTLPSSVTTQSPSAKYDPATMPDSLGNPPVVHRAYPGMPDQRDWLEDLPSSRHDGQDGFELQLVRDLAAVGVRAYTLSPLNKLRPLPQAIPVYLDWLEHLDERIPGPEGRGVAGSRAPHKLAIHTDLISNLDDRSARGNTDAIRLLTEQLRHKALDHFQRYTAARALATVSGPREFDLIAGLIAEQPEPNEVVAGLLTYFGRGKDPRAPGIVTAYLHDPQTRNYAIEVLGRIKAPGTRQLIEPFLTDPDSYTRRLATRVIKKLPEQS